MCCSEENKTTLGTYALREEAIVWWRNVRLRIGVDGVAIVWETFKREFLRKYFPADVKNKKVIEFMELKQGNLSVAEYTAKFEALCVFSPHYNTVEAEEDKATLANINVLKGLFQRYGEASGQIINPSKSTFYVGSIYATRINRIVDMLGFFVGTLPFIYLGVPIFNGKPKACHLQPIADRIKAKLAAWKASLLSIAGRVQIVKSIIHGMLIYSFMIYAWLISLLKDVDRWIRNFIWSGNVDQRKLVTDAWDKVCTPTNEGGLGLRSLRHINEATNLKLCWELFTSFNHWASLLRARVMRSYGIIDYHISSSIWSGIKHHIPNVTDNTCWQLGKGDQINFWTDSWVGDPLVDLLDIPRHFHALLQAKVAQFIANDHWLIPHSITSSYPNLVSLLNSVTIPISKANDELRWIHSDSGVLSFKDAYLFHRSIGQHIPWAKIILCEDIPPSKSCLMWRIMHNRLPTDDLLSRRGCYIVSKCDLCREDVETIHHIFCDCCFSKDIWHWNSSFWKLLMSMSIIPKHLSSKKSCGNLRFIIGLNAIQMVQRWVAPGLLLVGGKSALTVQMFLRTIAVSNVSLMLDSCCVWPWTLPSKLLSSGCEVGQEVEKGYVRNFPRHDITYLTGSKLVDSYKKLYVKNLT
ncbi:unnamed protein product [Trifolium pratense]|uniref:Uncharacterized protein n=1 Tax=Trifolium pratense TaxID=57577 RepID=A0ACB0KII7_TRIPR|nr:unnamed protein product [Trifolium pratense]